jgi:hypothetical protein
MESFLEEKIYFYNGDILDPNQSFQDYYIINGGRLVTVPIEQMNIKTEVFFGKNIQKIVQIIKSS